jgi:hypothetical protein
LGFLHISPLRILVKLGLARHADRQSQDLDFRSCTFTFASDATPPVYQFDLVTETEQNGFFLWAQGCGQQESSREEMSPSMMRTH